MSYLGRSAKLSLKAQEKVSFLATAGQTVKTGLSYVPSFVEVYVNGVLLTDTTDFTATNGSSVTFTVALLLNDEVTVISLKTFTVADHYSKTEADTLLAAKATNTDLATTNTAVALKAPIASPSFTGNVGVGTSASNAKLEVAASSGEIFRADAAGGAYRIVANQDGVLMNGNVGIGVTPESWQSSVTAIDVGTYGSIYEQDEFNITSNSYLNASSQETYKNTDEAVMYKQTASGKHLFKVAPSGTADSAISWNTAMSIDNAGIVTKPFQPAFHAMSGAEINTTSSTGAIIVEFYHTVVNTGGHYSTTNDRFTAPVAGVYKFSVGFMSMANRVNRFGFFKNGSVQGNVGYVVGQNYQRTSYELCITLAVNDYVDFRTNVNANTEGCIHDNYRYFTGYLIG